MDKNGQKWTLNRRKKIISGEKINTVMYLSCVFDSAACSHLRDDGQESACSKAGIQEELLQHLCTFLPCVY